jgi:hypothetical protein
MDEREVPEGFVDGYAQLTGIRLRRPELVARIDSLREEIQALEESIDGPS